MHRYYADSEVDSGSQPFGFSYDMGSNGSAEEYAIYWDVNLNRTRALDLARAVIDGGYFDAQTESVSMTLITSNRADDLELVAVSKME